MRLQQGDMARATVFNRDQRRRRKRSSSRVFEHLHLVDLDGAFAGKTMNASAVERHSQRCQDSAATRRRYSRPRHHRWLAWQGRGPRHHRHRGGARSGAGERSRTRSFPEAASRSGSTRATAKSPSKAGLKLRNCRRSTSRSVLRTPASPRSSIPTWRATACSRASIWDATIALADAVSIPVIASGGLASIDDIRALLTPRAQKLEGAIAGRALYDGRPRTPTASARAAA